MALIVLFAILGLIAVAGIVWSHYYFQKSAWVVHKKYGIGTYLCCNESVGSGRHHLASDQDAQR